MWPFIYVTFCRLLFGRLFGLLFGRLFGLLNGLLPTGERQEDFLLMNFLHSSQSVARSRGRLIIQPSCQPQTEKKQALPHAQYSADFNVYRNQCA
jgi:hypothetical protein